MTGVGLFVDSRHCTAHYTFSQRTRLPCVRWGLWLSPLYRQGTWGFEESISFQPGIAGKLVEPLFDS